MTAGLAHLHSVGCENVELYVEASEEKVISLYTTAGFRTLTIDTATSIASAKINEAAKPGTGRQGIYNLQGMALDREPSHGVFISHGRLKVK